MAISTKLIHRFFEKIHTKKNSGGGMGLGGRGVFRLGGGQGGCERIIEVFVKIHKKKIWGGGSGGGGGGQSGCEPRI